MASASTQNLSLTQAANLTFHPPEMAEKLIAAAEHGAGINSGFDNISDNRVSHKGEEDKNSRIINGYMNAINDTNVALRIGAFAFSAFEIANSLAQHLDQQRDGLELSRLIDQANQDRYMKHPDGTLFTPAEIADYEAQNLVCVANPHEIAADMATLESDVAATEAAQAALQRGETIDLATLPPAVAQQMVRDKITDQIANGETVDLSTIPPEFQKTAIDAVISAETEGAGIAAYQKLGLTEQDFRNGAIFTDAHADLRTGYLSDMSNWEDGRRTELSAEAGIDYEAPAPALSTEPTPLELTGESLLPPPAAAPAKLEF